MEIAKTMVEVSPTWEIDNFALSEYDHISVQVKPKECADGDLEFWIYFHQYSSDENSKEIASKEISFPFRYFPEMRKSVMKVFRGTDKKRIVCGIPGVVFSVEERSISTDDTPVIIFSGLGILELVYLVSENIEDWRKWVLEPDQLEFTTAVNGMENQSLENTPDTPKIEERQKKRSNKTRRQLKTRGESTLRSK